MRIDQLDWTKRTVGVTGAGGFIGRRALEQFAGTGAKLRGLDCAPEAAREAESTGADVDIGDTRDDAAARRLCRDCDLILHTAAIVGEGGEHDRYRQVNVEGTRTMLEAAAETGVDAFVHLSSVMVYGFDFPPEVDEEGPLRGEANPYCETKLASDRLARSAHGSDLEVLVIRAGDVYGPRSKPWVVRPLEMMKKRLFALPDGGQGWLDPTYIDNLLDAIGLLVSEGRFGEAFNVTDGRTVTAREFFSYHADMLGGRWIPTAPAPVLEALFRLTASGFRVFGAEPPATPDAIHFLNKPGGYSDAKLRNAGHEPRVDLEEGMRRVERWARDAGLFE